MAQGGKAEEHERHSVEEVAGVLRVGSRAEIGAEADLLELESGALVPVVFIVERTADRTVIDPPAGLFDAVVD